jgi:hypothetical protein
MYTMILELLIFNLQALKESGDDNISIFYDAKEGQLPDGDTMSIYKHLVSDEENMSNSERVKLFYMGLVEIGAWHEDEITKLKEKRAVASKYSLQSELSGVIWFEDRETLA